MDKNPNMTTPSFSSGSAAPFAVEIKELETRASKLKRHGHRALNLSLGSYLVVGIAVGVAWWLSPSKSFSSIDVPKAILVQFSDVVVRTWSSTSSHVVGDDALTSSVTGTLSGMITMLRPVLIGVALFYGLFMSFVKQSPGSLALSLMIATSAYAVPSILEEIGAPVAESGSSSSSSTSREWPSERSTFKKAIDDLNLDQLTRLLDTITGPSTSKQYVLAQVAYVIAQKEGSESNAGIGRAKNMFAELKKKPGDELKPSVLFVLDQYANGKSTVPVTMEYEAERLASAAYAQDVRNYSSSFGSLAGVIGLGLLGLSVFLGGRIRRIKNYIGWKDEVSDEHANF